MDIDIKIDGVEKNYKIIEKWSDVTLQNWVGTLKSKGTASKDALESIAGFTTIPKTLIDRLSVQDVATILKNLAELQGETNALKDIIEIDGQKYGFHPNLEKLSLGEWIDIEVFIEKGIELNLHKIMATLYRPVISESSNGYEIAKYEVTSARDRSDLFFKTMNAEQVNNALVFFCSLGAALFEIIPLFLGQQLKVAMQT